MVAHAYRDPAPVIEHGPFTDVELAEAHARIFGRSHPARQM
ncbi:hypothetical protein [Kitasatospora sp. NPDC048407]